MNLKPLYSSELHVQRRDFLAVPRGSAVRQPGAGPGQRTRCWSAPGPGKYFVLISRLDVKNAARKRWQWHLFQKKEGGGSGPGRAEPGPGVSVCLGCTSTMGPAAALRPCPIFPSSVVSSHCRRQQKGKLVSQTGRHRVSRDTDTPPTVLPLSRCPTVSLSGSASLPSHSQVFFF